MNTRTSLARRNGTAGNPVANMFTIFDDVFRSPLQVYDDNFKWSFSTLEKPLEKDEARISLDISVFDRSPQEQNKKLAIELRKLADKLEAESLEEEPVKEKESVVNVKVNRG
jgi:hypothetical protein